MEFDWDFSNEAHIARHRVEPEEAEEAATDPAAILIESIHRGPRGQLRFGYLGATEAGRILVVILEPRGDRMRVATARPANIDERRRYETEE